MIEKLQELKDMALSLKGAVDAHAGALANSAKSVGQTGCIAALATPKGITQVTPTASAAASPNTTTFADFRKMSSIDRAQFASDRGSILGSELSLYNPAQLSALFRAGAKVHDDYATAIRATAPLPIPTAPGLDRLGNKLSFAQDGEAKTIAEFRALDVSAKMEWCRNGGRII